MTYKLSAYLEQSIMAADPVELVRILYRAAIGEIRDARRHLAAGDIRARSRAITKAWEILLELSQSLNPSAGKEIAERLGALYHYMQGRLLEANSKQIDGPLAEVLGLMTTLAEGWDTVPASAAAPEPAQSLNVWAPGMAAGAAEYAPQSWSL